MRNPQWDAAVLDAKRLVARAQKCQAYEFADGFDNYNTASEMYDVVNGTCSISSAYVRVAPPAGLPGQGMKFASNGAYVRKNLSGNVQTFIIKIAVNFAGLGITGSNGNPFLSIYDSGTSQCGLTVFPSGAVAMCRQNAGTLEAQTGPGVIAPNAWYGIEWIVSILGSSSSGTLWINGTQVLTATGINMQATGNAYGNAVFFGDINNNGLVSMLVDDFRVWDNTGSTQNAPLGYDSRIVTKLPSGVGIQSNWTPNGAASNYACVNENPPDGDSTYVSSSTAGTADSYAMPSAGFTVAPVMVVSRCYARKDDANTRAIEIGAAAVGGASGGGPFTITSSYTFFSACLPTDPFGAAWTAATADAAQHYKVEST